MFLKQPNEVRAPFCLKRAERLMILNERRIHVRVYAKHNINLTWP